MHDYSVLKSSVFVSLMAGIGYSRVMSPGTGRTLRATAVIGTLGFFLYTSLSMHDHHFTRCQEPDRYANLGTFIREHTSDDEVVFASPTEEDLRVDPRIIFYAGRNIQRVNDPRAAKEWLRAHGREKGVLFGIAKGHRVGMVDRITR